MKHISTFLAPHKAEFAAQSTEKGSREWNTFEVVRGDKVDTYPVRTAYRPTQRYTNIIPIRRIRTQQLSLFGTLKVRSA